ncbi:helix-turn-helix transcriptional regulator [Phycicoccus sp. BSK3Z-2]|uniref:Helix-turn-helix transcriptional regulator n=1 Tax=Phycicoccus avicenniae TaxID=2828860 RepID=A0A941I1S9_9MICO|nr:helix-turn-helix transcriptional regulator [Phycicoccus avicenniae]MBR7744349.1 helix-turn-helix transcriptional regulator [Phycicoccus avicenniae]
MAVYINGQLLREALLRHHYTDREFCRATGIAQQVLRAMLFRNEASPGLAISDILACARATGLSLDDLLTEPLPEPSREHQDDAIVLAQILAAVRRRQPTRRIAAVLGWDLPRTHAAITDLDARLEPLGMKIATVPGVAIASRGTGLSATISELNQRHDAHDGLHHGAARTLKNILNGTLSSRELPNDTQVQIGMLINRGAITLGPSGEQRFMPSEHLRFALLDDLDTDWEPPQRTPIQR